MMVEAANSTEALEAILAGSGGDDSASYSGPQQHTRLVRALANESTTGPLSSSDFAVLIRAVAREASLQSHRDGLWVPRQRMASLSVAELERHGLQSAHRAGERIRLRAIPWRPSWLQDTQIDGLEASLFRSEVIRREQPVDADPVLIRLGHRSYSSEAQREAVRTVLGAPPSATVVVLLPTGSGKTVCGLLPAVLPLELGGNVEADRFGVTPFIVPTVSLALDLERRVAEAGLLPHPTAWRP